MSYKMQIIAHIKSDFPDKFGIPRQSGILSQSKAQIIFEPEYRNADALRGMEGYSHLWLIWVFSEAANKAWSPTVRPPKLGGNKRVGVFASRSPYRPNPIGLSSVKIETIDLHTPDGPIITVSGADLMDGTPILDIKPYIPYSDCHIDAACGFSQNTDDKKLAVEIPEDMVSVLTKDKLDTLIELLAQDPRPGYQHDEERIYGLKFAEFEIKFQVAKDRLKVHTIEKV